MNLDKIKRKHKKLLKLSTDSADLIQEITELTLYGDAKEDEVFEYLYKLVRYFQEKNVLLSFYEAMRKIPQLEVRVLEKLSITNVHQVTNWNYLVGRIHSKDTDFIQYRYNYSDDDVVDNYINFLKVLYLRINEDNFQLFYNSNYYNFPVLWQAQKFLQHPNNMVSISVQNIILGLTKLTKVNLNESTKSIIFQQNAQMHHFIQYLHSLPFRTVWVKFILLMRTVWRQLNVENIHMMNEKFTDIMFVFQDIYDSCPFLGDVLTQELLNYGVIPVIRAGLLGQGKPAMGCEVALFIICRLMDSLPIKDRILKLLNQDTLMRSEFECPNFAALGDVWRYEIDPPSVDQHFRNVFEKQDQNQSVIYYYYSQFKQFFVNDQAQPNPIKAEFARLINSKDNTLLLLCLAILQRNYDYYHVLSDDVCIKLIQVYEQHEILSVKTIESIIILVQHNQAVKPLLQQVYSKMLKQITNLINNKEFLNELSINWYIVDQIDWPTLKNSVIQPIDAMQRSEDSADKFKFVYKFILLGHLLQCYTPQPPRQGLKAKDSFNPDNIIGSFLKIVDRKYIHIQVSEYLLVDEQSNQIICFRRHDQPDWGKVVFVEPACATEISYDENEVCIMEAHRGSILQWSPREVHLRKECWLDLTRQIGKARDNQKDLIFAILLSLIN